MLSSFSTAPLSQVTTSSLLLKIHKDHIIKSYIHKFLHPSGHIKANSGMLLYRFSNGRQKLNERLEIWTHFSKILMGQKEKCNYRERTLKADTNNGTSSMRKHLKACYA